LVIAIVFFATTVSEKDVRRRFFRNEIQVNNLGTEFCDMRRCPGENVSVIDPSPDENTLALIEVGFLGRGSR
jgi:hypothetical protein